MGKKKKKALQKYILFLLGEPSVGLIITDKKSTVSQGNTTHWYHKNSALKQHWEVHTQCTYNQVIITMVMSFNWLKTVGIYLINATCYSLFLGTENPASQGNLRCDNLWKQGTWE